MGIGVKFSRRPRVGRKLQEAGQVLLALQAEIVSGPETDIGPRPPVALWEEQNEQAAFAPHACQGGVVGGGYSVQQNPGDHVPVRVMADLEPAQGPYLGSPAVGPHHQTGGYFLRAAVEGYGDGVDSRLRGNDGGTGRDGRTGRCGRRWTSFASSRIPIAGDVHKPGSTAHLGAGVNGSLQRGFLQIGVEAGQHGFPAWRCSFQVAVAGPGAILVAVPERQGVAAGVHHRIVEAQGAKLWHAPRHDGFAAHPVPELRLPFQHKDTGTVLGHSLGQRGTGQATANGDDVVVSRCHVSGHSKEFPDIPAIGLRITGPPSRTFGPA